ncbi:hypothetical protein KIPB_013540 [Kipferlia bialata]|uniref:Uncharacterized protein n=1 Tax=Kipferlia bialata TaxID=797122 RepID=A0A391NSJ8_9EUKA|nr:hypothetical protein KIPB_013540 [Kipferlia bialata]|eukprot:g13540.t1
MDPFFDPSQLATVISDVLAPSSTPPRLIDPPNLLSPPLGSDICPHVSPTTPIRSPGPSSFSSVSLPIHPAKPHSVCSHSPPPISRESSPACYEGKGDTPTESKAPAYHGADLGVFYFVTYKELASWVVSVEQPLGGCFIKVRGTYQVGLQGGDAVSTYEMPGTTLKLRVVEMHQAIKATLSDGAFLETRQHKERIHASAFLKHVVLSECMAMGVGVGSPHTDRDLVLRTVEANLGLGCTSIRHTINMACGRGMEEVHSAYKQEPPSAYRGEERGDD